MSGLFGPYPNSSGSGGGPSGSGSGGTPTPTPVPAVNPLPGLIKRTAGETIAGHRAVYVHSDNEFHLADLAVHPDCWNVICGITPDNYIIGNDAYARFTGELSDPAFRFVDGPIFLGANGTLTQSIPTSGPIIVLGQSIGPNAMSVQVQYPANGVSSGSVDDAQVFQQPTPSSTWTITHSFPRIPNVSVYDSTGRQVFPDVTVINSVTILIEFNGASDGTAILT